MTKILLVTSRQSGCGISEHSDQLLAHAARPDLSIRASAEALDPSAALAILAEVPYDLVHLNYHAALHSRWTPGAIAAVRDLGVKLTTTFHDTGVPNSEACRSIVAAAHRSVVHEPAEDLPADQIRVWRMGVPAIAGIGEPHRDHYDRPILGTVGHDFPWKCYEQLARCTADEGWGLLIFVPTMTGGRATQLHAITPHLSLRVGRTVETVVQDLRTCDATAFTYTCANTGQSGAVTLGIAAKQPILALQTCRQFRCYRDEVTEEVFGAFHWASTFAEIRTILRNLTPVRIDPRVAWLAAEDGWPRLGRRYADLWTEVIHGGSTAAQ